MPPAALLRLPTARTSLGGALRTGRQGRVAIDAIATIIITGEWI